MQLSKIKDFLICFKKYMDDLYETKARPKYLHCPLLNNKLIRLKTHTAVLHALYIVLQYTVF